MNVGANATALAQGPMCCRHRSDYDESIMTRTCPLIAVVDDDASVRVALQRLIRSAGLDVMTFPSGAEILTFIQRALPDCIVLDLHMPNLTGFDVQMRLSERGIRVPIIVITANDTQETKARARASGVSAYLRKPFDDRVLLDAIAIALNAEASKPSADH
jgi:FixJ family two-component response regulator